MKDLFLAFAKDDDGAITVDFVVLTAAICMLGFIVVISFSGSATNLANDIANALANVETS